MSKLMPIGTVMPMSHLEGQGHDSSSASSLPVSESEDDQQGIGRQLLLGLIF